MLQPFVHRRRLVSHILRPQGSAFDPRLHRSDLLCGKPLTFGWHALVIFRGYDSLKQRALRQITRHQRRPIMPALQRI